MYQHILVDADGQILSAYASPQAAIYVTDTEIMPDTHWYDWSDETPKAREPMPVVATPDGLSGVPWACRLVVSGPINHDTVVPAGDTPMRFDAPGTYEIRLEPEAGAPRWLPWSSVVEVVV